MFHVFVKFDMAQYPYEEMSLSTWLTNTQQTHMIHQTHHITVINVYPCFYIQLLYD